MRLKRDARRTNSRAEAALAVRTSSASNPTKCRSLSTGMIILGNTFATPRFAVIAAQRLALTDATFVS